MDQKITLAFGSCLNPTTYYSYQKYYLDGLRAIDGAVVNISPFSSRVISQLREHGIPGADWLWLKLASLTRKNCSLKSDHVGRYTFEFGEKQVKVAIDDADGRGIRDKGALEWSDIYFKANKWADIKYPEKVYPIVNGNGKLDSDKLDVLKQHRQTQKTVDLVYLSKIWSTQDSNPNVIEHQIRLFETLSSIECKKDLRAIIAFKDAKLELKDYLKRLDIAGVQWSTSWGEITSPIFWQKLAQARVVFQRSGNHHCISWRMIDLCCMGACIVMDKAPYPQWPEPLRKGVHFVDCECGFNADYTLPPNECYAHIKGVITGLLEDEITLQRYRKESAAYYESYAAPKRVAAYIIDKVRGQTIV